MARRARRRRALALDRLALRSRDAPSSLPPHQTLIDRTGEVTMSRHLIVAALAAALLLGAGPAFAGPAEEVAELAAKRAKAFSEGNPDAYVADFADNAVFTPSLVAFRIEGKPAIRAFFAGLFQTYPNRQAVGRQVASRVYANDTVVVVNAYTEQTWVDRTGRTTHRSVRTTTVWVKVDGKWLTVEQDVSAVPATSQ